MDIKKSLANANAQSIQMKRVLESPSGKLLLALKKASNMLLELSTARLPPKDYYLLYNLCFDSLSVLQSYLLEAHKIHHLTDVYEIVQYTGNVLPRLYLMITVGTSLIETSEAPTSEVLKDMLEMSRGVQHPLRGLFLRYYLGQRTAKFITSPKSIDELKFNIQFTLTNFIEMNKLWVRFAHHGHSRDLNRRQEERTQLESIVGSSILRLAQIDDISVDLFKQEILPAILDQVVQCRDNIAQEYLLEAVIVAFPAEYHLNTLEEYLEALKSVKVSGGVLANSMTVLEGWAKATRLTEPPTNNDEQRKEKETVQLNENTSKEDTPPKEPTSPVSESRSSGDEVDTADSQPSTVETNTVLPTAESSSHTDSTETKSTETSAVSPLETDSSEKMHNLKITDTQHEFPPELLSLYWTVLNSLELNPTDRAIIARQFISLHNALNSEPPLAEIFKFVTSDGIIQSTEIEKLVISIFNQQMPVDHIMEILSSITDLLAAQSTDTIKSVTDNIFAKFLNGDSFGSQEQAENVLKLFGVLLRSGKVSPVNVRKLIHILLKTEGTVSLLQQAYTLVRDQDNGGIVVYAAIEALHTSDPTSVMQLLKFSTKACNDMATVSKKPSSALRLSLQCALAANAIGAEEAAYELFVQSLSIYEEDLSEVLQQVTALSLIIQSLQQTNVFTSENFEPLAQRCIQHAQHIFKKPQQCKVLLNASHLFWDNQYSNGRIVDEVLSKALRAADSVMDSSTSVTLFLDVLDAYLYYLSNETPAVTVAQVNKVITLVKDNLQNVEDEKSHLQSRLNRIQKFVQDHASEFSNFSALEF